MAHWLVYLREILMVIELAWKMVYWRAKRRAEHLGSNLVG